MEREKEGERERVRGQREREIILQLHITSYSNRATKAKFYKNNLECTNLNIANF